MMKRLKLFSVLLLAAFLCVFALAESACAVEGGVGAYPNGADDFMAGALPPPGIYFQNTLSYYTADDFMDDDGNSSVPEFEATVVANAFRGIYVTKHKVLGAFYGMHAIVPVILYDDLHLPVDQDTRSGLLGNMVIGPLVLGWHWEKIHALAALDILVPTGSYSKDELINPGKNYWTFEPVFCLTYLNAQGFELTTKFMYDINTENDDTHYQSGQEFHFDYTIAYHINNWAFGAGGYYYQQITDDEQYGEKVGPDGNKGKVFAVGPQAMYNYKNMIFTLKWHIENEAENKPEGDSFNLKFVYAF